MKRRKFIEATLLAVPAATSAAGMRLYGTPGSVPQLAKARESEKLLLPISKSGLPPEFWSSIKSVTSLVDNVLKSKEEGDAFYSAPGRYLASHGLDSSDATLQEESVKLIAAISSSRARGFMEAKDYRGLIASLEQSGVLTGFRSTGLQHRLESVLKENGDDFRRILADGFAASAPSEREALLRVLGSSGAGATEDDLALAYQLMSASLEESPVSIVLVAIALVLVTVVAEVMVVTVVSTFVSVWGTDEPKSSIPSVVQNLAKMDPALAGNFERIARISAITGDKGLVDEGARNLILLECSAIVNAMQSSKILDISPHKSEELVEVMTMYACKVMGI